MYPNLYYVFKDWFNVEWEWLKILNTFGLFVAVAFLVAIFILREELKRREKLGLLFPREVSVEVGKPASWFDLLSNAIVGFIFGSKVLGLILNKPDDITPPEYIFSTQGNLLGGILLAAVLVGVKWYDGNKQKLKTPEKRILRIWPHDRVGDIFVIALITGILGAKLFDNFEHWDEFMQDPVGRLFSQSGLTFYGGLILASLSVCFYAYKKGIKISHLVDSAGACLLLAYAIGRIGCQVSGDGDWGIFNSAYASDATGKLTQIEPGQFEKNIQKDSTYFLKGYVTSPQGKSVYVTDRIYNSLAEVPHAYVKGVSFLPKWFFAYSYPQNVNKDGIYMPNVTDEHRHVLPSPVFPTPLYEIIICTLLFLFMWSIRKKIKAPWVTFGLYLVLNGIERFVIEIIRVNISYKVSGLVFSQAQQIAIMLIVAGVALIIFGKYNYNKTLSVKN
jgi:phosphatidylglycerol---prolipoprotein diacylglyceryl transferase